MIEKNLVRCLKKNASTSSSSRSQTFSQLQINRRHFWVTMYHLTVLEAIQSSSHVTLPDREIQRLYNSFSLDTDISFISSKIHR